MITFHAMSQTAMISSIFSCLHYVKTKLKDPDLQTVFIVVVRLADS